MSAPSSTKGTRKTYSFEEREILITLINKHGDVEDKKSDPSSMCKRKSAWAKLAEDYNAVVGPYATRSSVQLRRCWENMKACKRNREEKRTGSVTKNFNQISNDGRIRLGIGNWQDGSSGKNLENLGATSASSVVGLPPNVVFEPKASEPFTLQSVSSASKVSKLVLKNLTREFEEKELPPVNLSKYSDYSDGKIDPTPSFGPMGDCLENSDIIMDHESSTEENPSDREDLNVNDNRISAGSSSKTNATQTTPSSQISQNRIQQRRINNAVQRGEELHVLALSEAQMKVDIAAMQKEEAKVKLEEVRYRKEEARLRMLFFTYKLDRLKED